MNLKDSPSRCPECQSRLLKSHEIINTFEEIETIYWQCVSCGLKFDWRKHGKSYRTIKHKHDRIILAPGELNLLTKDSHKRTVKGTKHESQTNMVDRSRM